MITAQAFVYQAKNGNYLGIPYKTLDCQAFVERVLKDARGGIHNWRGSNHMWREALSEKHPLEAAEDVSPGAWLFTLKYDGGEKARGYKDNEGNAKHVGIYLGNGEVIHSTSAGGACVQMDKITSARWTAWGLCKYIDYAIEQPEREKALEAVRMIEHYILSGGV